MISQSLTRFTNKALILIGIAAVVLLLAGCPYSSTVPLSQPSVGVAQGFYGKWMLNSTDENPSYYQIGELDGLKFTLDKYSWDSDTEEYSLDNAYAAWFTDIGETRFMNVEDTADEGTYYLYKVEMDGDTRFFLFEVTDNIDETFDTSGELYDFFAEYRDLSFFYNSDEETYVKAE